MEMLTFAGEYDMVGVFPEHAPIHAPDHAPNADNQGEILSITDKNGRSDQGAHIGLEMQETAARAVSEGVRGGGHAGTRTPDLLGVIQEAHHQNCLDSHDVTVSETDTCSSIMHQRTGKIKREIG